MLKYDAISLLGNKLEQKHRVPDTYVNNDYAMQMLWSLWGLHRIQFGTTQNNKKPVSRKNR